MKTKHNLNSLLTIIGVLLLTLNQGWAQGSLTPPGAPAPTMKTLAQIEPRTPISSLPFTISNPGSYYVTTNLTYTGSGNGISITASNVTLDLNGFILQGTPNSSDGILVTGGVNVAIRNGALTGWGSSALDTQSDPKGLVVERVRAYANNNGFNVTCTGFTVRDCVCESNSYDGIYGSGSSGNSVGGTISGCTVVGNKNAGLECYYGTVKDCMIISNSLAGIFTRFSQMSGCNIQNCGTNGSCYGIDAGNCDIRDCHIQNCVGYGIYQIDSCRISDCYISSCSYNGIQAFNSSQINNCHVEFCGGIGIYAPAGSVVHNCHVNGSGNYGIEAFSSTVSGCTIENCAKSGIYVNAAGSLIQGNHLRSNNSSGSSSFNAGIYINDSNNRVEDNHITVSGYAGIAINNSYYSNNVVVKNYVQGNGANNYLGTANNDFGPIGSAATVTSPWANISH
jgi:parallel beta-helix repeat protein